MGFFWVQKWPFRDAHLFFKKNLAETPTFIVFVGARFFWPSCQKMEILDTHQKMKKTGPGRLLTLEIARFSLISGPPKKCRNHSFFSTPPKNILGPKTSPSAELYQKDAPPASYQLFLFDSKKQGKHRVFRFSCSRFSAHFSLIGVFLLQPMELRRGGQKHGKTGVFIGCAVPVFVVLWSPHGHLSSSYTLFFAKVSFILVYLVSVFCRSSSWSWCFIICVHLCLYCVLYFWFCCFSFLQSLLV